MKSHQSIQDSIFNKYIFIYVLLPVVISNHDNSRSALFFLIAVMVNIFFMFKNINRQTTNLRLPDSLKNAYRLRGIDIQLMLVAISIVAIFKVTNWVFPTILILLLLLARWFDLYRLEKHFEDLRVSALFLFGGKKLTAFITYAIVITCFLIAIVGGNRR